VDFSLFLSSYYPDTGYPAARLYDDMVAEARLAEQAGFRALTIPEHQFINILMVPSPLMLAVKVAGVTERIPLVTSVLVLPFHDVKRLAGEIAFADCLTGGRIQLGVGRGAFAYEFERFGVPIETSRGHFDESLAVLEALLTREEVSWDGEYYRFAPLTVMPRPVQKPMPPVWIAALAPEAIYHCARKGYNVQATPLKASPEFLRQQATERDASGKSIPFREAAGLIGEQAAAYSRGAAEAGDKAAASRFSMLRVGFVTRDAADTRDKLALARGYYQRFANMRESRGDVRAGAIEPIEIADTVDDLAGSLLIGTADEIVDRLAGYPELGIHEVTLNMNIGADIGETLASIERFAAEVMPHFADAG
jgi:alkanesulfonate monooxygenase SsuD/methylene tetrahydromethanopterin reductase-like flavin-dependent oxidoreductase (luciferase family)